MGPEDRDYFIARYSQERDAAARATCPEARERHEEMASLYRMRVTYIDHGLFGWKDEAPGAKEEPTSATSCPAPSPILHKVPSA